MINGFVSSQALALLFIFFGLAIAVIIKLVKKNYSYLPYAPTLFLISMALGYFSKNLGIIGTSIQQISQTDPRGILLIFLPPLIFESSFNSDWYIFRKQSVQIFILAFPAVLVSALLIMFSVKAIIGYDQSYYSWSEAFMFGSVLSCTDTVAVLALLKEAGAPRKFSSLIEGESLFNDGTCMVLFTISLQIVGGSNPHILSIIRLFLQLTIGAIILGIIFGFLSTLLISKVSNNAILTLNVTVVSCYIIYFVAEYVELGIKVSGIMALVSMGLYMAAFGKTKIAAQAKATVHNFWKIYIFVAETIIFILGGVLVGVQALNPQFIVMMSTDNINKLFLLYLCMVMARFLSITIFMPKLQYEGYGLKWKQVVALTYGGLRGAVGIAFTLILASNTNLRSNFRMISLFNTSGCAFLTLMINAPTAGWVIRKLGLCVQSQTKVRLFKKFLKQCDRDLSKKLDEMRMDKYLANSNWEDVKKYSGLGQLKTLIQELNTNSAQRGSASSREMNTLKSNLISEQFMEEVDPALMQQLRHRFCLVLKGILWQKFQKNQCSGQSIRALIQCVNLDLDSINQPLNSWDYLISHLHNPYFFPVTYWLKNKPLIGSYAYSWIYDRVGLLYDVISTYLEALKQAEQACGLLPFENYVQQKIIQESGQNRKLAQSFLDYQIKISYLEIMKRIQTTKAAYSLLRYQKQLLTNSYQYGQVDDIFYKQISRMIYKNQIKLQNDSILREPMKDIDFLKESQFFSELNQKQLYTLLSKKDQGLRQKDQPIVKAYQRQKYLYFITRGQIMQQYKIQSKIVYRRNIGLYGIGGAGMLLIPNNKELQYYATAVSIVNMFCFQMSDIKQLISQKPKMQSILHLDIFLLNTSINASIANKLKMSESEWRRNKSTTIFKKLKAKQTQAIGSGRVVLMEGKISINGQQSKSGYYQLASQATVIGPAKYYFSNIPFRQNQRQSQNVIRDSGIIRVSVAKKQLRNSNSPVPSQPSIIRRTIFTRD